MLILGQKTISMSIISKNTTTSNDLFDSQQVNNTAEQNVQNNTKENNLYLNHIDKKFELLIEKKIFIKETKNKL